MPNVELGIMHLAIALSVAVLLVLFYGIWTRQRIDVARRKIFVARDMIFLEFAESHHTVGHESHIEIRKNLNRLISYAHLITWFRVILYIRALRDAPRNHDSELLDMLEAGEFKDRIRNHIREAYAAVIWLMIHRSALLIIPSIIVKIRWQLQEMSRRWQGAIEDAVDSIVVSAEKEDTLASASHRAARA